MSDKGRSVSIVGINIVDNKHSVYSRGPIAG